MNFIATPQARRRSRDSARLAALAISPASSLAIALAVSLVACGSPRPAPAPAPTPTRRPTPERPSEPPPASAFTYRPGRYTYEYTASGTIVLRGDTLRGGEPLATTATITFALASEGRQRTAINGTVDSFRVFGGTRAVGTEQRLAAPISFSGWIDGAIPRIAFTTPMPTDCGSPAGAALATARDILIPVPANQRKGTQWTDTITTVSCRGGVTITSRATYQYTIEGDSSYAGGPALLISRRGDVSFTGTGGAASSGALLTGHGTSRGSFFVDTQGRYLGGEGQNDTELTLTAGPKSQTFTQKMAQRITLK